MDMLRRALGRVPVRPTRTMGVAIDLSLQSTEEILKYVVSSAGLKRGDKLMVIHVQETSSLPQTEQHPADNRGTQQGERRRRARDCGDHIEFKNFHRISKTYAEERWGPEIQERLLLPLHQNGVEVYAQIYQGDPIQKIIQAVTDLKLENLFIGGSAAAAYDGHVTNGSAGGGGSVRRSLRATYPNAGAEECQLICVPMHQWP